MEYKPVNLSVDLIEATRQQIFFLQRLQDQPSLFNAESSFLKNAVRRYETCWLPLCQKNDSKIMVPPLDVHWVWYCHMTMPSAYKRDCDVIAGGVARHTFILTDEERSKGLVRAQKKWAKSYKKEPFHADVVGFNKQKAFAYQSQLTANLLNQAERHRHFFYQVSLPHYKCHEFLRSALKRYQKYLSFKERNERTFIIPSYDIEIVMRAHMTSPVEFNADLVGLAVDLDYDPLIDDRIWGVKRLRAENRTRKLWEADFEETYTRGGTGFRGIPPDYVLHKEQPQQMEELKVPIYDVSVEKLDLECSDVRVDTTIIKLERINDQDVLGRKNNDVVFKCKLQDLKKADIFKNKTFSFPTNFFNAVRVSVEHSHKTLGQLDVKFSNILRYNENDAFDLPLTINDEEKDALLTFRLLAAITDGGPLEMTVNQGEFAAVEEPGPMIWGPVPFRLVYPEQLCIMSATHEILNHQDKLCYKVKVMHSIDVHMSAAQLLDDKYNILGVTHLINSDQLPTPAQVTNHRSQRLPYITLSPESGERAMIIKDGYGDARIMVARWALYRRGNATFDISMDVVNDPCTKLSSLVADNSGFLFVKSYNLRTGSARAYVMPHRSRQGGRFSFRATFTDSELDLKSGTISVYKTGPEAVASVLQAFSIGILFSLCRPRPVQPDRSRFISGEELTVDDLALVTACGYSCGKLPSNNLPIYKSKIKRPFTASFETGWGSTSIGDFHPTLFSSSNRHMELNGSTMTSSKSNKKSRSKQRIPIIKEEVKEEIVDDEEVHGVAFTDEDEEIPVLDFKDDPMPLNENGTETTEDGEFEIPDWAL